MPSLYRKPSGESSILLPCFGLPPIGCLGGQQATLSHPHCLTTSLPHYLIRSFLAEHLVISGFRCWPQPLRHAPVGLAPVIPFLGARRLLQPIVEMDPAQVVEVGS